MNKKIIASVEDKNFIAADTLHNVSYGHHPLQKMDIYLPAARSSYKTPVILLLHGGAWVSGDKADMNEAVQQLQEYMPDVAFANINYRLAALPCTSLWPTQLHDVRKAILFLKANAQRFQVTDCCFVIGGASAGAHLALLTAYTDETATIKVVADLFGPSDMVALYQRSSSYQSLLAIFMSGTPATNSEAYYRASPLNFVNRNAVPTIILHGTVDYVVPLRHSEQLYQRLNEAGVATELHTYNGEGHGFWSKANTADAFKKMATFVQNYLQ